MLDRIRQEKRLLWYFGDVSTSMRREELIRQAWEYTLMLIHPTNSDISPEDVLRIKAGRDGIPATEDDVIIIGYLSVGEDIRTDNDHGISPDTGDGSGPVYWDYEADSLVRQYGGYADYYLDDKDRDGKPDRNWQYGGCYADPGNEAYQRVLKGGTKGSDGFCGLDELFQTYHCDGVFLDTMDVVNPNGWGFPFYFEWTASGGRDFIARLRSWFPNKLLLLNRTMVYFDPNQIDSRGNHYLASWGLDIAQDIDLLLFEGFYWPGDERRNKAYWAPRINAEADRPGAFTILNIDYVGDASITIDGRGEDWLKQGYLNRGVEKLDDRLIWSEGVRTPEETADTEDPRIDLTDLYCAGNEENTRLFFRFDTRDKVDLESCNYYLYLDTDQNSQTGFLLSELSFGADYLLHDGDGRQFHLYRYSSFAQDSWSWEWVAPLSWASELLQEDGAFCEIAVDKKQLGEAQLFDEALNLCVFTECTNEEGYQSDSAPDALGSEYYQYLERSVELALDQSMKEQGWISYNKPLVDGPSPKEIDLSSLEYLEDLTDDEPPVWDSTAASPGAVVPEDPLSRVGIQEAEGVDGAIIVRWDTARDTSRPVSYRIYLSESYPFETEDALLIREADLSQPGRNYLRGTGVRTDFPDGNSSPDGAYSTKAGEGVYPYEYTIDGLTNGKTYYLMVRASDGVHEDTNLKVLSATPRERLLPDTFDQDWEYIGYTDYSPNEQAELTAQRADITGVKIAEDSQRLYFRLEFASEVTPSLLMSIFLDTDRDKTSGYSGDHLPLYSWALGADYLIENDRLFAHSLTDGYRYWNWEEIGSVSFRLDRSEKSLLVSLPKAQLEVTGSLHLAVRALDVETGEKDLAPNDLYSHFYEYESP